MLTHNSISESEEMYLITIAQIQEETGAQPIPLSKVSARLAIQPVSANQMVHRLESEGLVQYRPYKGVELTEAGNKQAKDVLRRRRLWEVFLTDKLHYPPSEADEVACRLEHAIPNEVAERLSEFLSDPNYTIDGKQIPRADNPYSPKHDSTMTNFDLGIKGEVTTMQLDAIQDNFIRKCGILPGSRMRILARNDNACLIATAEGGMIEITNELAKSIYVAKV